MEPVLSYGGSSQQESNNPLPPERARLVLRKLRDLDLRCGKLEIDADRSVSVEGCLSPDTPLAAGESGATILRYRLVSETGEAQTLEIGWQDGALLLRLIDPAGSSLARRVPLLIDKEGRASSPDLAARMAPDSADVREVEHFLRRLIRGAYLGA